MPNFRYQDTEKEGKLAEKNDANVERAEKIEAVNLKRAVLEDADTLVETEETTLAKFKSEYDNIITEENLSRA